MKTPLVSVLMSVHNGERYLSEAIESILKQTFTDFEFLIINDSSTDSSREIISSYKDSRIRFIDNDINIGLTRSLNKGLAQAKGKYIARLDADDVSLPERLERQVNFMEENEDIAVCGSSAIIIDSNSEVKDTICMPLKHDSIVGRMFFGNCIIHSSVCFNKKNIIDIGGYNNEYNRTQDYELWCRCIAEGLTLENLTSPLIKLRKHADIISVKFFNEQEYFARKVLKKLFSDILYIQCSTKSISAYRKVLLNEKKSILDSIRLFFLIKNISKKMKIVFLTKEDTLKILNENLTTFFITKGSSLRNISKQFANTMRKKFIQIIKRVLLLVPAIRKYMDALNLERNTLLGERNTLLEERNAMLEELAYNYAHGSLSIGNNNIVNRLIPILQEYREVEQKKKKKILFVAMAHSIHTARWVDQLLDREEWDLHLFPSMDVGGQIHPLFQHITIHLPLGKAHIDDVNSESYYAFELSKLIKTLEPDIVHSLEMQHAGYLTLSAKKIYAGNFPKWIYSCWGSDIYYFQHFDIHKQRIQDTLSECDYLITDTIRDIELAQNLGFNGELLGTFPGPGGFDVDSFRSLVEYITPSERKVIVLKGYYGWVYRPMILLEAIEKCKDLLSGYKIVVYLPGEDLVKEIEKIKERIGLDIDLFNFTTAHDDVLKLFASARIALASSISDGTPNSMLEAMTMGAFPIQSDTISTQEWIHHGSNGMLAAPEDVEEFAACLKEALMNDTLVDNAGQQNYKLLKERIDESIIKPQVLNMYDKILNK